MLPALPIHNVRLTACAVAPEQLTPGPGGQFCAACQRVVHDFTGASQADLARAQAAAPDGRVCGRFRLSQLAPESRPARLRRRLRLFLLVAGLVLVQGLNARQAWAQLRPGVAQGPGKLAARRIPPHQPPLCPPDTSHRQTTVFGGPEKMPVPPGSMDGLMKFLAQNLHYPATQTNAEGKVFVSFVVQPTGQLTDFKVVKGIAPAFDAEALRVLRLMPAWTPGEQNGRPVACHYTVPVTFRRHAAGPAPKQGRR